MSKPISKTVIAEIRKLCGEGISQRQIAAKLGLNRKTVQNYYIPGTVTRYQKKQIRSRWAAGLLPEIISKQFAISLEEIQKICADIPFVSKEKRRKKAMTETKISTRKTRGNAKKHNGRHCRICGAPLTVNYFYCKKCHLMLSNNAETNSDLSAAGQVACVHIQG